MINDEELEARNLLMKHAGSFEMRQMDTEDIQILLRRTENYIDIKKKGKQDG